MPRRRWTLILVPPDPRGKTRRLSVGHVTWRSVPVVLLAALAAFGLWEGERARRAQLTMAELSNVQQALVALSDTVRALRQSAMADSARASALRKVFMPVKGAISSTFSARRRHPILRVLRPHKGIDVIAPAGSGIVAPSVGVVRSVGWRMGYGLAVQIDHGNGVTSLFAHCRKAFVRPGQRVEPGERIALVGSTGLATGPHLHFELLVHGRQVDPIRFLARARSSSVSFAEVAQGGRAEGTE
ncbi:MAG: M23 family metallopeptidase [Gemmatimonadaceae bacterium]